VTSRPLNSFLRSLSDRSFAELHSQLTPVDLKLGAYLQHDGEKTEWVYFPETCLLSMIVANAAGEMVETSMAGREGAGGLLEACGSQLSSVECVVQVDGAALRAPSGFCRTLALEDPDFSASAWRMAEFQLLESRQSALCQATHTVERRLARWLLESVDRCGGREPLPMTQEFLAAMLGVQRSTVSMFASGLQRKNFINYRRGRIEIVNREGLEALACDCRRMTEQHRARLGFALASDAV
jgi:CRP-like cAMP-binding protein